MMVKSFGCSFIFGSDLPPGCANWDPSLPSQVTWPALLAQKIDQRYACYARSASGNLHIANQVLAQIAQSQPDDIFIIGWSWIDRFDYYDPNIDFSDSRTTWKSILPVDQSALSKIYYKQIHSEYRDKLTSLIYIKTVLDALLEKKLRFVMTYMDHLLFDNTWHVDSTICFLQNCILPHMTTFEGVNFLEWSRKKGFAESKDLHPLAEAHRAAADYMYSVVFNQLISD